MLDLLVRVPEVEVEQVEYLGLVHLAPTDLVVLQLVPGDEGVLQLSPLYTPLHLIL